MPHKSVDHDELISEDERHRSGRGSPSPRVEEQHRKSVKCCASRRRSSTMARRATAKVRLVRRSDRLALLKLPGQVASWENLYTSKKPVGFPSLSTTPGRTSMGVGSRTATSITPQSDIKIHRYEQRAWSVRGFTTLTSRIERSHSRFCHRCPDSSMVRVRSRAVRIGMQRGPH